MYNSPPSRSASRRPKQPNRFAKKKKRSVIPSLLLCALVLAALVILLPKEPLKQAHTTIATADGQVTSALPSSAHEGLRISELMSSNSAAVPDKTGDYPDWVEIWNSSDRPIEMQNVGLSDRSDSIRFLFPAMTLEADERVIVFCSDTNNQEPDDLHAKFKLSSVGETVYLFDPNAYVIDQVTVPILNSDESYMLNAEDVYEVSNLYTPGYPNTAEGNNAYIHATTVTEGALIINEIMADPRSGLLDEDGELVDWLELYNTTSQNISLDNYALSNNPAKPLKWHFPEGAVVPAGGYYLVFCSGKDRDYGPTSIAHASFKISAERDTIVLSDSRGRVVDRVTVDNLAVDHTWGRNSQNEWQDFSLGTPGYANNAQGTAQAEQLMRALNPTGVIITEAMASNRTTVLGESIDTVDWVELYNTSNETVYLENYGLSDNIDRARKWQFPAGTAIAPGQYMMVYLSGDTTQSASGQLHTSFKLLRAGGETICFSDPTGLVLDKIELPLIPTDISYGRTLGLNGFFYYDAPTPGQANGTGFLGFAEEPVFSLRGGLYDGEQSITISIPEGSAVYYTTDGSVPDQTDTRYEGETILLNRTAILRARAFKDGLQPSTTATNSYFINTYHALPVVSIAIEPDYLWNEETGMLVDGKDAIVGPGLMPFKNTVYREYGKIEREGHIEYYQLDNTQVLSQGMGMRLAGDFSLDLAQKSMKIKARSAYGEKYFNAKLFEDRPFTQYKSFLLRNSGNDGVFTRLIDGLQTRLVAELDTSVIFMAWNPVVVYINGIYWGHYNMREAKDQEFIAQHEGLDIERADEITVLMGNMSAVHGSNKEYKDMINKVKTMSPGKNPEDLKYITDRVDVDNYFDYIAIEMFFGNSDIGNMRMYKLPGEDSKWRWQLYDLDYALFNSAFDSPWSYMKEKGMGQAQINNTLLRKLMENDEMRDLFLTKLGTIFQKFTTEHMLEKMYELQAIIEPEMTMHFNRWSEEEGNRTIGDVPTSPEAGLRYWKNRISGFATNVITKRPYLFWGMVQKEFKLSDEQMVHYFGPRPEKPAIID